MGLGEPPVAVCALEVVLNVGGGGWIYCLG